MKINWSMSPRMHNLVVEKPIGITLHIVMFVSNGELLIWLVVKLIEEVKCGREI